MSERFARLLQDLVFGFFGGRMIPVKVRIGGRRHAGRSVGMGWIVGFVAASGVASSAWADPGAESVAKTAAATKATAVATPLATEDQAKLTQIVARGVDYLRSKGQAEDGSFSRQTGPAVSALCVMALLESGVPVSDPAVAKGLAYLDQFIHDDGAIYKDGSTHVNYETCIGLMCLVRANQDGRYDAIIAKADKYLKGIQWDESEGKDPTDPYYGGAGYGSHKRPDLSNTSFFIDALRDAGNDEESEAIQRALIFVSRCQNLESEHNTTPFAAKINDGGFYYTPAAGGTSQAGTDDDGGLRSYASMTYAGLKSMIYAGVTKDDPRVEAALQWLGKNYNLDTNPGMGDNGLYYYYHTFAKALRAAGQPTFKTADAEKNWRADLIEELASRQRDDGAWLNTNARWMEGDANLVTGYALLALAEIAKTTK